MVRRSNLLGVKQVIGTPFVLSVDSRAAVSSVDAADGRGGCSLGEHGWLLLDVATNVAGVIASASGPGGRLELSAEGGRLNGLVELYRGGGESGVDRRILDAEDALGIMDGDVHTVALGTDAAGMALYLDGYQAFSTTLPVWLKQIGADRVVIDPAGVMSLYRAELFEGPIDATRVLRESRNPEPDFQFAAPALSAFDTAACGRLAAGTIRTIMRTRGKDQGGTIFAAKGTAGTLELSVDSAGLSFQITIDAASAVTLLVPGAFDEGQWHDIAIVAGNGQYVLYVDGYQVAAAPGNSFFRDLGELSIVCTGQDVNGRRLFGESTLTHIYARPLSDAQVKLLAGAAPLATQALFDTGLLGAVSYRIPSLLRLESGVVLAGADQRVSIPNDAPNDINFVLRRSVDDGVTWEEPLVVLQYPGTGLQGASVIDSVLLQDRSTGRVFLLIDFFPGGTGQFNSQQGSGFSESGELLLYPKGDSEQAFRFTELPEGYQVACDGTVIFNGNQVGNIYLHPDATEPECLHIHPTSYLLVCYSDDDGVTWSKPRHLNAELKQPHFSFLGTGPGNGIQLPNDRLIVPGYLTDPDFKVVAIFSDDHGETWQLGEPISAPGGLYESTMVWDGNLLHVFMRNQHPSGLVAHASSRDGGQTWSAVDFVADTPEIFSQPNAVSIECAGGVHETAVVFANATRLLPFRGCGVLRLGYPADGAPDATVTADDAGTTSPANASNTSIRWAHSRVLQPRHYVYQCMAQADSGELLVLWEREWQGLFLTRVPLSWLEESVV